MSHAPSQHNDTKLRADDLTDPSNETIVDNRSCKVGDFVRRNIKAETDLAIVSVYFTICAYDALHDELEQAEITRFVYGDPATAASHTLGWCWAGMKVTYIWWLACLSWMGSRNQPYFEL